MKNVLRVLGRDFKRLLKAPAALVVVFVLVVLPSTYTWFNVIGFWNPYDNTGNMRVCVVNEDTGGSNDIMGDMNLGNQIVDQLHENNQLKWEFTDYEDAMEKVNSGEVYAAFVIPSNFTEDLFTILTGDFQQPNLQYYVNEKKNPVSPKVTDAGSTTLDDTINSQFVSTVSSVVADTLNEKVAEAEQNLDVAQSDTIKQLNRAVDAISDARATVTDLTASTTEAQGKAQSAKSQLSQARSDAKTVQDQLQQVYDLSNTLQKSIGDFSAAASPALSDASVALSQVSSSVTTAASNASSGITGAQGTVDASVERAQGVIDMNSSIIEELTVVYNGIDDASPYKAQLKLAIDSMTSRNQELQRDLNDLKQLYDDTEATASQLSSAATTLNTAVQQSIGYAGDYQSQLFGTALPQVNSGISQVGSAAISLKAAITNQGYLIDQTSNVIDQLTSTLGVAADALSQTDGVLADLQKTMSTARNDVSMLGTSTAVDELIDNGRIDPEKIAEFMASPTQVTTEKLYPLNAYGSAMAPLFISLSLWIGTLMLCVILKLEVDKEGVPGLTVVQGYLARWLFFAVLVTLQAIVCVTGCLAIGVQTVSVPAFYATAIALSLAYLCITYTLSSSFQHIGIGLCIIMVFVQIPGGTGLYPVEMTDAFFRIVYPLFPFTYGINALREAIGGFYGTQWLGYMGVLVLIGLSMAVVGLFVRPHLTNLNRLVAKEIQKSDLLNVEEALVPERRYRIGQLIRALADHDEFHNTMQQQADRFMKLYPRLKRGALIVGILVPVAFTAIFAVTTTEKVVTLTGWLIWLVFVIVFLLGVEMVRDNIQRQAYIDTMSDDELREHLADRGKKVVKELVPAAMSTARVSVPVDRTARSSGVTVPLPPVGKVSDDLHDKPEQGKDGAATRADKKDVPDASNAKAEKPRAKSLMDLAAANKPAYFDGPFLSDEDVHGKHSDDEDSLAVESPALELTKADLETLSAKCEQTGDAAEKRGKHAKKAKPADGEKHEKHGKHHKGHQKPKDTGGHKHHDKHDKKHGSKKQEGNHA